MTTMQDRVLDVAENRMRADGFHAVSFRELANELGIKSASVHYHFRHKRDLGTAVVHRYAERFFAAVEETAKDAIGPEERIKAFCATYKLALQESNTHCLCGMLGAESKGLPEDVSLAVATFLRANVKWVHHNLALPENDDEAERVVATLQGSMMMAVSMNDPSLFDRSVKRLLESLHFG